MMRPPLPFEHQFSELPAQDERGHHVDPHDRIPPFLVNLLGFFEERVDARIVDQDVDRPPFLFDRVHQTVDVILVRHVTDLVVGPSPFAPDFLHGALQEFPVPGGYDHVRVVLGKGQGDMLADPAVSSGHQNRFAVKIKHGDSPFMPTRKMIFPPRVGFGRLRNQAS